jgi:bacterial peptide chain release factor 1 (bRF-1)
MLDKLEAIRARFQDLGVALTNPEIVNDNKSLLPSARNTANLEKIVKVHDVYKTVLNDIDSYREALKGDDEELRELAKEELPALEEKKEKLEAEIRQLLIPKDPQDERTPYWKYAPVPVVMKPVFCRRPAAHVPALLRAQRMETTILSETEGTVGGYKEVQVEVVGDDVYGTLKFESGVHRVQRVPDTEASGRVHTSAATVAVMPEADEVDVEVKDSDVKNGNRTKRRRGRPERKQGRNKSDSDSYSNRHRGNVPDRTHPAGQP